MCVGVGELLMSTLSAFWCADSCVCIFLWDCLWASGGLTVAGVHLIEIFIFLYLHYPKLG